jgi:hypothetical protein
MRTEVNSLGETLFSRWRRAVAMWTMSTTAVVTALGYSHCFVSVIDPPVNVARPDGRHSESGDATEIQFLIDALQSSQSSLDQPDLRRALSFVARFQPQRTLSESEPEEPNRSRALTAVPRGDAQPFRSAQIDATSGQ